MSTSQKAPDSETTSERIDELMKAAHRERNEAIAQLFGFGYTVLKDAVRTGFGHRVTPVRQPTASAASRG